MLKIIKSVRREKTVTLVPISLQSARPPLAGIALAVLGVCSLVSCGNKGDLYLPVDKETLEELEQAEKDLEEAARKKSGSSRTQLTQPSSTQPQN